MKYNLIFLFVLLSCSYSYSQIAENKERPTIGFLVNHTTPKQDWVAFTSVVRGTVPVYKKISLGAELNYTYQVGRYGDADYAGAIAFARINPYQGFIGELGYSYNKQTTTSLLKIFPTQGLFVSLGYKVKICKSINIEFQYRALPSKYFENQIINSRIYLLGVNYIINRN